MGSTPSSPASRRQEIEKRLVAIRARLRELRQKGPAAYKSGATAGESLESALQHAAEAHAAATEVLAASVGAFRNAAEAHERAASLHQEAAASGIGDVHEHEQQAVLHRAAAADDWRRAQRTELLISEPERARRALSDEPGGGSPDAGQGR